MKKIGILGGISLSSTIEYYRSITSLYYERFADYYYPEIVVNSLNFQYFTDLENSGKMDEYKAYILKGLLDLKNAGADFAIMAANSPHSVLNQILDKSPLPILSIMESVAKRALELGIRRILLTGILYTMNSDFYPKELERYGIETILPNNEEKSVINNIIFQELVLGRISSQSKERFLSIINAYYIDAVLLGCTELPQLISQQDTKKILLNSLEIHSKDALKYALTGDNNL